MIQGADPRAAGTLGVMFTADSVQAIAADNKTQTRRLFTHGNSYVDGTHWKPDTWARLQFAEAWVDDGPSPAGNAGPYLKVPYNPPDGDGLHWRQSGTATVHRVYPAASIGTRWYVKEGWGVAGAWAADPTINYRADGVQRAIDPKFMVNLITRDWEDARRNPFRWHEQWRSPLMMPRWAARHFLEVTRVRIERLQCISDDDCLAEGAPGEWEGKNPRGYPGWRPIVRRQYQKTWDLMHRDSGTTWADNPWITVYDFRRLTDAVAKG